MKTFIIAMVIFLALDMTWLGFVAKGYYRRSMGGLLRAKPSLPAASLFYIIFIIGLIVFVINPALPQHNWHQALGRGALFGFVTYATYDLTNLAVLKDWPLGLTAVDLAWGTFLSAAVATLTTLLA